MRHRSKLFAVLLVVWALVSGGLVQADEKDQDYELFKLFVDSFEQIERNYVKEVDRRELMEAAIKGMLKKLDPYSNYIGPDNLRAFSDSVEQQFGGIGIRVTLQPKTNRLMVASPLPGAPAQKAGVRPGDIITDVGDESAKDFTMEDAVKRLRGKPGTPVTIKVLHPGDTEPVEITIVRDIIRVATVRGTGYDKDGEWKFIIDPEHKIAYVRLISFSRNSTEELKEVLQKLEADGIKGLILDLRFNPGGLLSAATEISDLFIDEGKIVSTKGRNTEEQVYSAHKDGTYSDIPMVILVNRSSASASEIVSACLQDHKRALIIGERTWGKGSVQNVINLENEKSALKLTTASYHRPSGKNIHRFPGDGEDEEWGVLPDEDYRIRLDDKEFQELFNYLTDREQYKPDDEPKDSFKDRQFDKAVEYLVAKIDGKEPATPDKKDEKESVAKKEEPAASEAKPE